MNVPPVIDAQRPKPQRERVGPPVSRLASGVLVLKLVVDYATHRFEHRPR